MAAPSRRIAYGRDLSDSDRHDIITQCSTYGHHKVTLSAGLSVFVKYGNPELFHEAVTQSYFYNHSKELSDSPGVAQVYEVFQNNTNGTYLAMEYLDAPTMRDWLYANAEQYESAIVRTTNAVKWMMHCPVPEGTGPGPVGGGPIQHSLFSMEPAAYTFDTTQALNQYMNFMLNWPNRKHTNNFIPLEQEPFFFNPSDVKLDNFLYDDGASKLYIVDWQHVNALPHSFASFYFHRSQDPFVKAIAERLTLAVSPNLPAMQTIASKIRQTGNRTGNPKYPPIQQKEVLNSSSLEARQTF